MKVLSALAVALALAVFLTASASAHNMTVTHPNTGAVVNQQWIGGSPLPPQAQGQGLFDHPAPGRNQPAGHREGLPEACEGTESSPAVSILSPPFFTGCVHGEP
jgi:hypothetical protein